MKALSIKQPYVELILQGRKKIELRKWNTKFRGEFIIHASKVPDVKAMKRFGFKDLPFGCVVGKVTLVDIKKYNSDEDQIKDKELHLADTSWGTHGFILENPIRFEESLPWKGNLNFWEFKGKL